VLIGELALLTAAEACVDDDGHALLGDEDGGFTTILFDGCISGCVDVGEIVPWPSVAPGLLDELLGLMSKA
jgi:hypothetical protein